jgi:hypothetical protein
MLAILPDFLPISKKIVNHRNSLLTANSDAAISCSCERIDRRKNGETRMHENIILPVRPYERGFQQIKTLNIYRRAYGKYKFIKTMTADWGDIHREIYRLNCQNDGEYFDLKCIAQHAAINAVPCNQPYMD